MGSIGSVTKPIDGFLTCLVQYPVPVVNSRADVELQIETICKTVANTKAGYPGMELIVFPEYSTQGLNTHIWFTDRITDPIPGPASEAFCEACAQNETFGVFHILEKNPDANQNPFSTAIVCDPNGKIVLKYRKIQPWVPIEPWHPGDLGVPTCDGPAGSKLAVCIGHDGMFPEVAREAAYNGANVLIRVSGYNTMVEEQWYFTNRANAWSNLMYTLSVNLAGYDGVYYYIGQGMACNFDGAVITQGQRDPWEIVSAEIYPRVADNARLTWGMENNIFNMAARGYVAVPGGTKDNPFNWVRDLAEGKYHLPWEDKVVVKDGSLYGYPKTGEPFKEAISPPSREAPQATRG